MRKVSLGKAFSEPTKNLPRMDRTLVLVDASGTYGHTAVNEHFDPKRHARVIIFADDQIHDSGEHPWQSGASADISHVPVLYFADLGGYGRYTVGRFSDALYKIIEVGKDADWPFWPATTCSA